MQTLATTMLLELADRLDGSATPFQQYQTDPTGFAKDVLDIDLWSKQKDILNSVRDNRQTAVSAAPSTGKSFAAAAAALWFLNCFPDSKVIVTAAPPERQIREILFGKIRQFQRAALRRGVNLAGGDPKSMAIIADDEHWIQGFTIPSSGSKEERIAKFHGHHAPHMLIIADEAHGVPGEIFEAFDNIMSSYGARLLILSNPLAPSGPFYQATRSPEYEFQTISALEHPNVVSGENQIPGAIDRDTTEARIAKWTRPLAPVDDEEKLLVIEVPWTGEKRVVVNPVFSYKVLGLFPWEADWALIPMAWVQRARQNYDVFMESVLRGEETLPTEPICGLDVAEMGSDANAFLSRYDNGYVAPVERWEGLEIPMTIDRACRYARRGGSSIVNVDGIGVGAGVAPQMKRDGVPAEGVKVSWKATRETEEFKFDGLRSQLWWSTREWLARPDVMLPPDDDLEADLLAYEYVIGRRGIVVSNKREVRSKLMGRSSDAGDALMLTFYRGRTGGGSEGGVRSMLVRNPGRGVRRGSRRGRR